MLLFRAVLAFGLFDRHAQAQDRLGVMDYSMNALSPRYYLAASPLQKRETGCNAGFHPCNDINATACCSDDTYCIVDPKSWQPRCCAIGSQCDSPCETDQYQCNATTTITTLSAATTSVYAACCPRPCVSTSQYLCPSSLGGGCCPYGAQCASGRRCLSTSKATSSTASAVVTEIPSGCTTSQIACPTEEGGGCCAIGKSCTQVSGSNFCVQATVSPTASGVVAVEQGGGLSAAAKGGIGAGVAVGASLLIGGLAWFCLRRRRSRSQTASSRRRSGGGRYVEGGEAGRPMTEATSDVTPSRPERLPGLAADYFGPAAVPGPFTVASNPASSPGHLSQDRAVPTDPHVPDDIAVPVEIDSNERMVRDDSTLDSNLHTPSVVHQAPTPETVDGRFELYGSAIPSPSPPVGDASSAQSPLDSPTMGHSTLSTVTNAEDRTREG